MAKQLPKVYYGLHFVTGVAQYDSDSDRVYVGEETAKQLDSTFAGKPLYVTHKTVNIERLQEEADGYVVESFYNPHDGKHWAKFVAVSDAAHEAIANGWRLSNAYSIKKSTGGGLCHNVAYQEEVLEGVYNHLAIVQNPRYEESVIMTPEEFKEYNKGKENELKLLANSKDNLATKGINFMFKLFQKKEIENAKELSDTVVLLKNGSEITVEKLIDMANRKNEGDEEEAKKKKELEEKEIEDKKNEAEAKAKEEEDKKNAVEAEEKAKAEAKAKEEEEEAKKAKEMEDKKNEIKNAIDSTIAVLPIDTTMNKVARGRKLYGSNN